MKALEKRPDLRYPTMDEMIRAMTDPVGYVDAHGGIQQFMARQLTPSTAPLPLKLTPAPTASVITPAPGTLQGATTAPAPTGFGPPSKRSIAGFVIAGTLVVAAAVVGILIVLSSKSTAPTSAAGTASASASKPLEHEGKPVDRTVDRGSGAVVVTPPPPVPADAAPPPPPASVKISLKSNPPGAAIFQDGKDTGQTTPAVIELGHELHKVKFELRLKHHQTRVLDELDVDAGDQTLSLDLKEEKKPVTTRPPPPHRGSNEDHPTTHLLLPGED